MQITPQVQNVSTLTITGAGEGEPIVSDVVTTIRRLQLLARVPTQIVSAQTEHDLLDCLGFVLDELFPEVIRFDMFLSEPASGALTPLGDLPSGLRLLATLHAGLDALPPQERTALGSTAMIPFLQNAGRLPVAPFLRGPLLAAPLIDTPGTPMGILVAQGHQEAEDFTKHDVETIAGVAAQFSLALQRLRAERRAPMGRRIERDLELARQLQRTFLPPPPPPRSGLRVAAEYRPAYDIGGDFYDLVPLDDGPVMAVIGDVAGKGISAALLMSRVSSDFRRIAQEVRSPGAVLAELNNAMVDQPAGETFVTAACLRIDARGRRLAVANAGHVPPILRRANGTVVPFGRPSGAPLGMLWAERYADEQLAIEPGDILFMMTDGLVEALDRPGDRLGMRTLLRLLGGVPPDIAAINRRVLAEVDQSNGGRHVDDVTLVAIEIAALLEGQRGG